MLGNLHGRIRGAGDIAPVRAGRFALDAAGIRPGAGAGYARLPSVAAAHLHLPARSQQLVALAVQHALPMAVEKVPSKGAVKYILNA